MRVTLMAAALALSATGAALAYDAGAAPDDRASPSSGTAAMRPREAVLRWSNRATWPGGVLPRAGAAVVIGRDTTVLLDIETPALASLTVNGTLRLDTRSPAAPPIGITATRILVNGRLEGGTETAPFLGRATITLTGTERDADVGTAKMLGVYPGGALELHGEPRTGWVRLAATAAAGATTLTLDAPLTGWRAGDRVVVASTDFLPTHAEVVTIRSVRGATVQITPALAHKHWGTVQTIAGKAVDERAEVGLLTRNILVQGDSASAASGFGGHIMAMQGASLRIEGVELTRVGQRGRTARYPIHWHMMGNAPGQYARRNSVWGSYNRCVTLHGTHGVTVAGNVCYDHLGHGYFLEDGVETNNSFQNNLGLLSRATADPRAVLPTDAHPATFWVTNPDNEFVGNVAAGSEGHGFWFALPHNPTGLSTTKEVWPAQTPLRRFEGNVSHSNAQDGLHIDNAPRPDGGTSAMDYQPRARPGDPNSPAVVARFQRFTAYKNRDRGVWTRGQGMRFEQLVLSDNVVGAQFAAPGWGARTVIADGLIVGESANGGRPPTNAPAQGFRVYDGPWLLDRVIFANFDGTDQSALSPLGYNAGVAHAGNAVRGVRMVAASPLQFNLLTTDGDRNATLKDLDGSLGGTAGATIVADSPLRLDATCRRMAACRAQLCATPQVGLKLFSSPSQEPPIGPARVRRDDGVEERRTGLYDGGALMLALPVRRTYRFAWPGVAPKNFHLEVEELAVGQWIALELPTAARLIDVRHRRHGTDWELLDVAPTRGAVAQTPRTTSHLDAKTGRLYLRLVGHEPHPADAVCMFEIQTGG